MEYERDLPTGRLRSLLPTAIQFASGLFQLANYVLSKSIDNGLAAENQDLTVGSGAGSIPNAFQSKAHRARSDFDLRHNFNAYGVLICPRDAAAPGE
jgi:hypothetical protein